MFIIPLFEKRINIIDYYLEELARLNKKIKANQRELIKLDSNERESNKYSRMRSIFIRFNTQSIIYMIA